VGEWWWAWGTTLGGMRRVRSGLEPESGPGVDGAGPVRRSVLPGAGVAGLAGVAGNGAVGRLLEGQGGGTSLPAEVRAEVETRFGRSFADVRVHTGDAAASAAEALSAKAFTVGSDVFFGAGRYAPGDGAGRALLAHELTHVVQNRSGGGGSGVSDPASAAEREAERVSRDYVGGRESVGVVGESGAGAVHREIDPTLMSINPAALAGRSGEELVILMHRITTAIRTVDRNGPDYQGLADNEKTVRRVLGSRAGAADRLIGSAGQLAPGAVGGPAGSVPGAAGRDVLHVQVVEAADFVAQTGIAVESLAEGRFTDAEAGLAGAVPGAGFGALQAPLPIPQNTTGLLWTGQHMVDVAVVNGSITARGYRAPVHLHLRSVVERFVERNAQPLSGLLGTSATDVLNSGTPGTYANDLGYLYQPGTTLIYRGPMSSSEAAAVARQLEAANYGGDYRFSPPPPGTPAFQRLSGSNPAYVPCAANNCITVPKVEHQLVLGGQPPEFGPVANPVDLTTGARSGTGEAVQFIDTQNGARWEGPGYAKTAELWANQPASTLADRGLVRIRPFAGMVLRGVIRSAGKVLLVYGAAQTIKRIAEAPAGQQGRVVAEEAGAWTGGWIGAALVSAIGGAVVCAETGPGAVVCAAAFGVAGGVTGSVVGQNAGADAAQSARQVGDLLSNPAELTEAAVQMFGTEEQRRQFYEDRDFLRAAGL
jgi:hypothetical protein